MHPGEGRAEADEHFDVIGTGAAGGGGCRVLALAQLAAAAIHLAALAEMMCRGYGQRLDTWPAAMEADTLTRLQRLAVGQRRDHHAGRASLILRHGSGRVEATANKIVCREHGKGKPM